MKEEEERQGKKKKKMSNKLALKKDKLSLGDFVAEYAKTGTSCCRFCELPVLSLLLPQSHILCPPLSLSFCNSHIIARVRIYIPKYSIYPSLILTTVLWFRLQQESFVAGPWCGWKIARGFPSPHGII